MKRPRWTLHVMPLRHRRARLLRQFAASLLALTLMCSFAESLQRVPAAQGDAGITSINVCDAGSAVATGIGGTQLGADLDTNNPVVTVNWFSGNGGDCVVHSSPVEPHGFAPATSPFTNE